MSDNEDYYYDDEVFEDEEDECDYLEEEEHKETMTSKLISLDEQDLIQSMNEVIQSVSSILSLPADTCSILLRNFHWDAHKLEDAWFSDQSQACLSAGLLLLTTTQQQLQRTPCSKKHRCPICFTRCDNSELKSAACGHLFCKTCWKQYITIAINDGAVCLTLRCPDPDCSVSIDEELVNNATDEAAKAKYTRLLVNNFVECSKVIKWCPAPGCQYAIRFTGFRDQVEVTCKCGYTFCWDCVGEPHRPVDCETALRWHEKINGDSLNKEWILVHSKPCPKCKRTIEKNQGCNHMTCTPPCKHQFCWLCMGPWKSHKSFYACNKFSEKDKPYDDQENERKLAKAALMKYTHYYERWLNNYTSGQKAIASLNSFNAKSKEILIDLYSETDKEIDRTFISAWKQIVECRRMLRWTYAYGYFLPKKGVRRKKRLFEDLQGQAEAALERLHHCVEKELEQYISEENKEQDMSKEFFAYKLKVTQLTNTTRNFFNNLVHGLETGLQS